MRHLCLSFPFFYRCSSVPRKRRPRAFKPRRNFAPLSSPRRGRGGYGFTASKLRSKRQPDFASFATVRSRNLVKERERAFVALLNKSAQVAQYLIGW